jgi:hypothetical protein
MIYYVYIKKEFVCSCLSDFAEIHSPDSYDISDGNLTFSWVNGKHVCYAKGVWSHFICE